MDPDLNLDGIMASAKPKINDSWLAFGTEECFPYRKSSYPKTTNGYLVDRAAWNGGRPANPNSHWQQPTITMKTWLEKIGPLNGDVNLNTTAVQWRQKGNSLIQLNNPPVAGLDAGGVTEGQNFTSLIYGSDRPGDI